MLFAPPTANTTTAAHATRHQTAEDLLAQINNIVAGTNGNIMTLTNRVSVIADTVERGFGRSHHLADRTSQQIADLANEIKELKDRIRSLQTPLPSTRNPIALPLKPANAVRERSRSRKGKSIEVPSPSPAPVPEFSTPTPTTDDGLLQVPSLHPHRAPSPSPRPATPATTRPTRKAAQGPKNNVAPPPGVDDPEPTPPEANPRVTVVKNAMNKPLRNEMPKRRSKSATASNSSPAKIPTPSHKPTPKSIKDRQLIIERPEERQNEYFNRALLCSEINNKLVTTGVSNKSGLISLAKGSGSGNIVLETDGDHNANLMWAFRNNITPVI